MDAALASWTDGAMAHKRRWDGWINRNAMEWGDLAGARGAISKHAWGFLLCTSWKEMTGPRPRRSQAVVKPSAIIEFKRLEKGDHDRRSCCIASDPGLALSCARLAML